MWRSTFPSRNCWAKTVEMMLSHDLVPGLLPMLPLHWTQCLILATASQPTYNKPTHIWRRDYVKLNCAAVGRFVVQCAAGILVQCGGRLAELQIYKKTRKRVLEINENCTVGLDWFTLRASIAQMQASSLTLEVIRLCLSAYHASRRKHVLQTQTDTR